MNRKHRIFKRLTALAFTLVLAVSAALPAAAVYAYETECPRCGNGVMMTGTPVQPTCIDDGYIQLECPVCHSTGTAHGALGAYGVENGGRHYGHDYGTSGICSRCHDDARPPQTRPDLDSSLLTGEDGHTHDFKLMGNMYARKENAGQKKWVCQTCQAVLMEDVPPLDDNGMAQPGSTFRTPGSTTRPSGSATNPGSSTTAPDGSSAAPGGSTSIPGESTTTPGTSQTCDHARQLPSEWTYETVQPTCTTEGRSYRTCKNCGYEETLSTIKTVAHAWEQKTVPATTASGGRTYRVCKVCGKEEILSTTDVKTHSGSGSTQMSKLSQAEITQLLQNAPLTLQGVDNIYDSVPSYTAPYAAGKVKNSVLQAAVNRLNAMRRIAGLPSVTLDSSMCETAQHGAVVNAANNELSHYPSRPADMDNAFYQKGKTAASSSNIAAGYTLIGSVDGYMEDSDAGNIDRVGHRSWQLNPAMGKVGFGMAGYYSMEMAHDRSGKGCPYDYISWPASGNFPSEIFGKDYAWSVYLNPALYTAPTAGALTVTLSGGGQSWTFRGSERYSASSSGKYFNYAGTGYGSAGYCVIFRPDGITSYDGTYTVTIGGLRDKSGSAVTLTYDVDFFRSGTTGLDGSSAPSQQEQPPQQGQQPQQDQQPQQGQQPQQDQQPQLPAEAGNPFTDVPAGTYYHDAVLWALKNGVTTGVDATHFQPGATCTRGQVVTFLWRAKGCPEPKATANPFRDVASSSPFYKAILWAQENGITSGTTPTTFNPRGTCTSAHVVTFLWRANGKPAATGTSSLAASYPGQYYTDAMAWADSSSLLSGTGTAFIPGQNSPRANIVTYLYRDAAQ